MHAITLSAKCIKNQIVLSEPIPISENAELLVTILPSEKKTESGNAFEQDWAYIGAVGLNLAYSEDEPEYTLGMLKRANPSYEGR